MHKLHVDRLKIDKSFIDILEEKPEIVSTIIHVAKGLHLQIIAEGVETKRQVELLQHLGCHEIQGFVYSKPLPIKDYELLLWKKLQLEKDLVLDTE